MRMAKSAKTSLLPCLAKRPMNVLAAPIAIAMALSIRLSSANSLNVGVMAELACAAPVVMAARVLAAKATVDSAVRQAHRRAAPRTVAHLLAALKADVPEPAAPVGLEPVVLEAPPVADAAACLVIPRNPSNAWMPTAMAASPRRNTSAP